MPHKHGIFEGAGAAPAESALVLRLVLAVIGVLMFVAVAVVLAELDVPTAYVVVPVALAILGVVDLGVVVRRLHRGEH
jgi:Family of unknown function (DUF6343)